MACSLRVGTYNVHGCVGTDGAFSVARVAQVICELNVHLIGLQEIHCASASEHRELDELATLTGLLPVNGGVRLNHRGYYGNALLTKLPVLSQARIDLTVKGREPRGALDVVLAASEGRQLRVIVTHLGLAAWERREQARRLVSALAATSSSHAATILLGDLNEWLLWGRPLRWLHAALGKSAHLGTFPSHLPVLALDRIWVNPRSVLRKTTRRWTAKTRVASDHLPLVGELTLPEHPTKTA